MANGTAVAQRRELTPAQRIKHVLDTRKDEFAAALAGRVDPEAFIRVAYTTITKSPKLLEATPASLMMALLEAATLGLVPNGVMGEAYIVPFNNKVKAPAGGRDTWEMQAQFIPGYRGLIKLVRQSGVVKNIVPRVVRQGDQFELEYGLDERLIHVPNMDVVDQAPLSHAYAVAHFSDGSRQFEVMSRRQIDAIRARSKSKDSGPWVTDYEPMALKTVIRRLVKYLPLSDFDVARAIEADNKLDMDDISHLTPQGGPALQPVTRAAQLRGRVAMQSLPKPAADSDEEEYGAEGGALDPSREVAVQGPEPADEGAPDAEGRGREPVALPDSAEEFLAEVRKTKPRGAGKLATAESRAELLSLSDRIFGAGTEEAMELRALAEDPKLTQGQAGKLIAIAEDLAGRDEDPDPNADRDPFGEDG